MPTDVRVVLATAPDGAVAEELAHALVGEGLAACVSLVPAVRSVYRWQGEIRSDAEVLVVVKTTAEAAGRLTARLAALHPYEVPEILELPVEGGLDAYLAWVLAETRGGR